MGRLKLFKIKLDNPTGIYFGGDVVSGTVFLGLDGDGKKARGVRVRIKGESRVHWTERKTRGSGDNRRTETVHYKSSELYVKQRRYVVGDESNEMQISAGDHEYSFQFQLPLDVPSSFVGQHGQIVYSIKATVDRPWRFDHETLAFFTVICIYDLNKDPSALTPQSLSKHKMLGFLCCESGPISAIVETDRSGYVSGETIFLQAHADNESDRLMDKTSVQLLQTITYIARGKTKSCEHIIFSYQKGRILPGESDSWRNEALKIPTLPPSDLPFCNNIRISYRLEFRVDPSGIGFDLCVKVPLSIGTIPLRSTFEKLQPPPPPQYTPDAPPFSAYPDLPPPTYSEAMAMDGELLSLRTDDDNEYANGNWDYKPRYPAYG